MTTQMIVIRESRIRIRPRYPEFPASIVFRLTKAVVSILSE